MKKGKLSEAIQSAVADKVDEEKVSEENLQDQEDGDERSLIYIGTQIKTADELLAHAQIDLRLWEIERQTVNMWEVTGKQSLGQDKDRRWRGDKLWASANLQIKVWLRRKAPKFIQQGILDLLKEVAPLGLASIPRTPITDPHLMEIGLHDMHFAKLCYGVETGTNYDLRIAEAEMRNAIDEMVGRAQWYNVERIVIPAGSDAFHYNSEDKMTANFTPMATSADDRMQKGFRVLCRCYQYGVEQLRKLAPVEVIYIAGNHDRIVAMFLTEWLAAKFDHDTEVKILNSPTHRKYISYGPTLLGYTHGDEVAADKLPGLMAQEVPELWSKSKFRSWRTGHFHKKKSTRFIEGDTHNGVQVYVFPSLCGTDSWHYRKGFVGSPRMAEVHFWSKTTGPSGMFYVHAKTPRVTLGN